MGVVYPLAWDADKLLGRINVPGERVLVGDGIRAVGYLARGVRAVRTDESVWDVVLADPTIHAPPGYVFVGSMLGLALGSPIVAHNAILFASIFLCFACMYGYAYKLTRDGLASLYAALFFGGSNYVVHALVYGHGNQIQLFWFPLAFWAAERVIEDPTPAAGALLGGVLGLVPLWVAHYAAFLAVVLPLYVLFRSPMTLRDARAYRAAGVGGVVALAVCGYFVFAFDAAGPMERTLEDNRVYSLQSVFDIVRPSLFVHVGAVPLALALAAPFAPRAAGPRARAVALMAVLLFSVVMALGPQTVLHPYTWFFDSVPTFRLMRTPVRFVAVALTVSLALAAITLHGLRVRLAERPGLRTSLLAAVLLASLAATPLMASEYYDRRFEPGHIWTVDVRSLPAFLEVSRR